MKNLMFQALTVLGAFYLPLQTVTTGTSAAKLPTSIGRTNTVATQDSKGTEVRLIEPGVSTERELAGGAAHNYRIELPAKHFVNFEIEKYGITLAMKLKDPTGKVVFAGSVEAREQGADAISLVTDVSGSYVLTIEPAFPHAPLGRYKLRVDELRDATQDDQRRFAAQQATVEADQLPETGEGRQQSLAVLTKSVELWHALNDKNGEARTLNRMGQACFWLNDYASALEHFKRAAELRRAANDRIGEAESVRWSGVVYSMKSDNQNATDYLNRALRIQLEVAERWQLAFTYMQLGAVHYRSGKRDEMLSDFTAAVQGFHAVGDIRSESATRTSLGLAYLSGGDYQSALNNLHPALDLFRTMQLDYEQAATLSNLGTVYYNLGEVLKALEYFKESLSHFVKIPDPRGEAAVLTSLGLIYGDLNDVPHALANFNAALGRLSKLADPRGEALIYYDTGVVNLKSGDFPKALEDFNQSLRMARGLKTPDIEASSLRGLGQVFAEKGESEKAIEHFNQALLIMRSLGDRHGETQALFGLARIARSNGRLVEARQYIDDAIRIIESLRAKVAGTNLRISYLAEHERAYELYIDILMRLHEQSPQSGYDAVALHVNERAHARALLESLNETSADIRAGVDAALLERERSTRQQLNAKEDRRLRLLSGKHTSEQGATAEREVNALLDEYQQVQSQIRAISPRYAVLSQPQPFDLKEIQAQLDPETLVLVYSLGEERSFLFAVTATTLRSYVLPKRDAIETEADLVYPPLVKNSLQLLGNAPGRQPFTNSGVKERELLSQHLLGPVGDLLPGKNLVIITDGKLQYVPFAALPEPRGVGRPLIAGHEIVNLPSISVLGQQRHELTGRAPAGKLIAVIGDPVYQADDERLKLAARTNPRPPTPSPSASNRLAAGSEAEPEEYQRLIFSRLEVEEIIGLVPSASYTKILDFDASLKTLAAMDLSQYRILHFSTHAKLDIERPDLSGIVLSLYNDGGKAQDGVLRSHELYNLKLGADLVVLSACETALGKQVKGEGLMGLARGFMYAGAPRVVVSLWKVDDRASAELMKRFYRGMFREKLRPAAALRAAQVTMSQEHSRWSAPYYWAGFVLQGDWR